MRTFMPPPPRWLLLIGLSLGAGGLVPASAQERAVAPGDRVRLTFPCDARDAASSGPRRCTREGTVERVTQEALVLSVRATSETHTFAALDALEVRRVTGPGWKIPAAVGAVAGGAGTYALLHSGGSTSRCDRSSNQDAMSRGECATLVALGSVAGAGLGALASRLLRTERWLPVPLGRIDLTLRRN